ncbi:Phosphodiest-domain-containing protein [Ceraceosorus guamensis]|uniref:Phosphodiest-domain-containing protein n=1 Tax=Ceraceosorus guamensis TaxID=1522189 RepID=A0A316W5Q9_9BASI|nr:Phosphodiest-domain-containing protein [Ceraceosorus guamensis]PWN44051.1 Phosphodiest-domain-containing protein [Ceraceosorus guamensis]
MAAIRQGRKQISSPQASTLDEDDASSITANCKTRSTVEAAIRADADGKHEGCEEETNHQLHSPHREWRGLLTLSALALAAALLIVSLGARPGSIYESKRWLNRSQPVLSNGTHSWHRTVLLLSLDGVRPDYIAPSSGGISSSALPDREEVSPTTRSLLPTLSRMHASGKALLAEYMLPVMPSLTFPNHWSILTGLTPLSHGIVANDFHLIEDESAPRNAPYLPRQFYYTRPEQSWDGAWWYGSPIWEVVQNAGRRAAVLMWPGPPVTRDGVSPDLFQKYEKGWSPQRRLDKMVEWLYLPTKERPELVCAYVPDIDAVTHRKGPDARIDAVADAFKRVDEFLTSLLRSIDRINATDLIDVVIVSDHGMTTTSNERLVYLDEVLGEDLYDQITYQDGWPHVGLHFSDVSAETEAIAILELAQTRIGNGSAFEVVDRENLLRKWGWLAFGPSMSARGVPTADELTSRRRLILEDRMAKFWIVPANGWAITSRKEMSGFSDGVYEPRGNHGYSTNASDMRAIFFATGPSFRLPVGGQHRKTAECSARPDSHERSLMPPLRNLEVHNLIADILRVPPNRRKYTEGTPDFWRPYLRALS